MSLMKKRIRILLSLWIWVFLFHPGDVISKQENQLFKSPGDKLELLVSVRDGKVSATLSEKGEQLIHAVAGGFILEKNSSESHLVFEGYETGITDEKWKPVWGTSAEVINRYRWIVLKVFDTTNMMPVKVHIRLYDEGFAFRYDISGEKRQMNLMKELSSIRFQQKGDCWWAWADYHTLEKTYQTTALQEATHAALPFTVRSVRHYFAILEAGLDDYPMMTLLQDSVDRQCYHVNLAPWADGTAVKTDGNFQTPWRVAIVAENPAQLLNTDIVLNLNQPCALTDISWIRPIRSCGIWWEMHLGLSTWKAEGGRHGATTANAKKHIDFASRHGLEGVLVEGWNKGWENWGQKNAFDYTTPYSDFDLEEVARYARIKGVELIGHHETGGDLPGYEARIDSAFSLYRRLGIRYVKTGYAGPMQPPEENHHGQYMVRHLNMVMRKAAEYKIMLDVHEPVIPSGLSRTYPNLMTFEAVRGMEWNAWSEGNSPSHNCILPFTRGLAGPMDYTPGIFDILLQYRKTERVAWNSLDKSKSKVHSTICHQLALPVVFYSPILFLADLPENYEGDSLFEALKAIPATWDETRILAAEPGEFVIIARRKGRDWFLAGITNEKRREILIPTDFLQGRTFNSITIHRDAEDSHFEHNPGTSQTEELTYHQLVTTPVQIQPGGGFLCILRGE